MFRWEDALLILMLFLYAFELLMDSISVFLGSVSEAAPKGRSFTRLPSRIGEAFACLEDYNVRAKWNSFPLEFRHASHPHTSKHHVIKHEWSISGKLSIHTLATEF
jgi:hypothetical protein